ncbi:hypothetical protein AB6A40_002746 [Gnathostoma spinigerum]|uniref:Topoisomerase 6 subunit A/Spo11 TOPRIM domain-containing protein n=1 Tax=Gnathostoma spinigerum TaxID=75299 RepID=A0ABD6EH84_9BILA
MHDDCYIDCMVSPIVITDRLIYGTQLHVTAKFALIVEKDAIFQRLLDDGFFSIFPSSVLITGKGYPDICTRLFLKLLRERHRLPIFALVDSDPHGIEIAMTYKYGGIKQRAEVGNLELPDLIWIGLSRLEANR